MLFNKLGPFMQKAVLTFNYVLISIFLVAVIVNGIHITIVNSGRIMNDIPISYSFVTIAVPAGALLMLITSIMKIVRIFVPGRS
jgi:TRAP-type C4-dicarboxylate transport system permease small subunit